MLEVYFFTRRRRHRISGTVSWARRCEKETVEEIGSKLAAEFFRGVELVCVEDEGCIVGFIGMADGKIEMLFVDAERRGKGIGGVLMDHALRHGVTSVDVNEQNRAALGFYESRGFKVSGRDETDDAGRPFPILHMSL